MRSNPAKSLARKRIGPLSLLFFTLAVAASADDITVVVPAFQGGNLGKNVGAILDLKLSKPAASETVGTTHYEPSWVAPGEHTEKEGGLKKKILWVNRPLEKNDYEGAEVLAHETHGRIVLWGNVLKFGNGFVGEAFLSILPAQGSFFSSLETWATIVKGKEKAVRLAVSLPRRRYEFSPFVLSQDFVKDYSSPSALTLYADRMSTYGMGPLGDSFQVKNSFQVKSHEGDAVYVVRENDNKSGWVHLPALAGETEMVNFTGGLTHLLQGDYTGAQSFLQNLSESYHESDATSQQGNLIIRNDALLLQALIAAKQGVNPSRYIEQAMLINSNYQSTIQFKIMSLLANCNRASGESKMALLGELNKFLDEHAYLFVAEDKWYAKAREAARALETSEVETPSVAR